MGWLPLTAITFPECFASRFNVTLLVVPWIVSLPVAGYVFTTPSAGTGASSIGLVSSNVAVGKLEVSMIRPWNCPSRWFESLWNVVMSTVNDAVVTFVPAIVIVPVTLLVLPTAVPLCPNSVSLMRYWTNEPSPTFQLPASGVAAVPGLVVGVVTSATVGGGGGSLWMKWK